MLTYPPQATVLEQPTIDWNFDSAWEGDRIILTASDIPEDQDLIVTARFAPDSLAQVAPQWQVRKERTDAATAQALPVGFIAVIATLILGGLGLLTYIRANGRDLTLSAITPTPNPPSDIPPALIGTLTKQQHSFMGTIFDLAQRGILEVREEKGFWGTNHHILLRKDHAVSLRPHEQGLMDALFKPGETQIKMNEIATRLAMKHALFDEPLEQELTQRGWLDPERKQRRTLGRGSPYRKLRKDPCRTSLNDRALESIGFRGLRPSNHIFWKINRDPSLLDTPNVPCEFEQALTLSGVKAADCLKPVQDFIQLG